MTAANVCVVHSMRIWLSQTMTWLHTQVRSLPPRIDSHIVCDKTRHLDQFPISHLISADRDSPWWRFAGAKSWRIARRRKTWLLQQAIARQRAAILHSHFGDRGWANVETASRTGVKHVVSFYGYDAGRLPHESPVWRDRYARLFATGDLFLCEGPHLGRVLAQLGCPAEKIRVHHLGINVNTVAFRPREWRVGEPLRVLIAGSFMEKKGFPYALEALARIKKRVAIEIDIVGDTNGNARSVAEKAAIHAAIDRGGLRPHTRLHGYRPHTELFAIAHRNHLFISPSVTASDGDIEGGAPVSIIEMAATGMPVVSTRHCDIPEVLEDGVTGLLADERDVDGLEQRLCWLLDNRESWTKMVCAARKHIDDEFSAAAQGRRLAMLYEQLSSAPRG